MIMAFPYKQFGNILLKGLCLLISIRLCQSIPIGTANNFPNITGNMTLTPTNGFGTYVYGTLSNVTCSNTLGNPLLGNNSVPCMVGMAIHNLMGGPTFLQMPNWEDIFGGSGGTGSPIGNTPSQCTNVGTMFNPTNSNMKPAGFIGNMEVVNGTGRIAAGPFNFTLQDTPSPMSVTNLPMVIWREPLNTTANMVNQFNPGRILSCATIRMTAM